MASKKLRFEIFKRDQFSCQYCGQKPPVVVLELDHINPKSKGGRDDISNYITACFECNRGKASTKLDNIPQSLRNNLQILREKQNQLKAYNRFIEQLEREMDGSILSINDTYTLFFPGYELTSNFCDITLKRFLMCLPKSKIHEAMRLACSRFVDKSLPENDKRERAIRYFCGICWNWIKMPETRGW